MFSLLQGPKIGSSISLRSPVGMHLIVVLQKGVNVFLAPGATFVLSG